jgi:hypothetical protein
MKAHSSRKTYGILPLTPAALRGIQLEFAMVESPAPRARFINFPFVDDQAPVAAAASKRAEKRQLAA